MGRENLSTSKGEKRMSRVKQLVPEDVNEFDELDFKGVI